MNILLRRWGDFPKVSHHWDGRMGILGRGYSNFGSNLKKLDMQEFFCFKICLFIHGRDKKDHKTTCLDFLEGVHYGTFLFVRCEKFLKILPKLHILSTPTLDSI